MTEGELAVIIRDALNAEVGEGREPDVDGDIVVDGYIRLDNFRAVARAVLEALERAR